MRPFVDFRVESVSTDPSRPAVCIRGVDFFDTAAVFDCGQAFRFTPVADSPHEVEYGGVAFGRYITVAQDGDELRITGATEEDYENIWKHYLGLDFDIPSAMADILSRSDNPTLALAVEYGRGIRLLRQDRWETLCSFIISQNNNIPRIRGLIETLSRELGERVPGEVEAYSFPTSERIVEAGVDELRRMKFGFRAPYIYDAASRVCSGELDLAAVAGAESTERAAEMLMSVKGVGPKVAACTLLFGFDRTDAFPVDVWVKRVIEKYFPAPFDAAALGPYAGLAQQYLFFYERTLAGN